MIRTLSKLLLCITLLCNSFFNISATDNENITYVALGTVFNALGIGSLALACNFLKKYYEVKKNGIYGAGAQENQPLVTIADRDNTGCWSWMLLVAAGSFFSSGVYLTTVGAQGLNQ